jgi:capsular polysaccharide biosynthesis protein
VGLLLGVLLSFLRPLEYSSSIRLQITQELGAVDAYTSARSAERIADDLASAVYFTDFFDQVMAIDPSIDQSYFPTNETKKRNKWGKTIATSVTRGTGILKITAYHPDIEQAQRLALAVGKNSTERGWTYTSGSNITIRVVDKPLNSRWPARPNVLVNGFSGLILGGLAGAGYLLIQVDRVRRRHQLVHEE